MIKKLLYTTIGLDNNGLILGITIHTQ